MLFVKVKNIESRYHLKLADDCLFRLIGKVLWGCVNVDSELYLPMSGDACVKQHVFEAEVRSERSFNDVCNSIL